MPPPKKDERDALFDQNFVVSRHYYWDMLRKIAMDFGSPSSRALRL